MTTSSRTPIDPEFVSRYTRVNLVADPIYGYVEITKAPRGNDRQGLTAEQDLLDNRWLQRARRIHQLQSAWWVFPAAEHSRFQHAVGAMHLAGEWARHLYASLRLAAEVPSEPLVEETLRLGGLLHDIGHGPFGHFFDEQYLAQFGVTHETISQRLIAGELAPLIEGLEASPHGAFGPGERVDPAWVAYVISKEEVPGFVAPRWLELLKPVLCGSFAADNMDYVPRDAYACGVSIGPVDVRRIIHYTFISPEGLALHQHGAEAMLLFLSSRMYLYNNLYHHRTVRRIDLHMREIFSETIAELMGGQNPLDELEAYVGLNDWHLLNEVDRWLRTEPEGSPRRRLAAEWARITGRQDMKWKLAYEAAFEYRRRAPGAFALSAAELHSRLERELPAGRAVAFEVDVASLDARPEDPASDRYSALLFDPLDGSLRPDATAQLLARIPMRNSLVRVFALDEQDVPGLREAAEVVMGAPAPVLTTNT
ncbi:MAG TPA: HD domain-containing protein [Candidatus Dormibacteraeota bacterium]|nr:HD domain-containing protein [Candidatus Dormibacteraeota bacterium]